MNARSPNGQAGFSLLEIVISIGILLALTLAVTTMLRAGFDVKQGLAQKAKVVHRLSVAMTKLAADIQHAFIISSKDQVRNALGRRTKGIFKIDKGNDADRVYLTTMTHRPILEGANESDMTYVVYELRESKVATGRTDLYRGSTQVLPEDFKEDPPMQLLARNIKAMSFDTWRGDQWMGDRWDSGARDTRNKIPRLVKVKLIAWVNDREDNDGQDESADEAVDWLTTVVYIPSSIAYEELKPQLGTIKWNAF